MMKLWRKYKIDLLLREAWENGTVMSGLSAGSICWFRQWQSDSQKKWDSDEDFGFIKVTGLGSIPVLHCPHYDTEKRRRPALLKMMQKTSWIAIALDNCAALEVIGDTYRIIISKPGAKAYKVYKKDWVVVEEIIEQSAEFRSIDEIFKK
jgi:dipeptidase E